LREQGFRQTAERIGASVETVQIPLDVDYFSSRDYLVSRMREIRVDGIFTVDPIVSVGTLLACLEIGMKPCEDFNLVGCDVSLWQSPPLPHITSLGITWKEVGKAALRTLLQLVERGTSEFEPVLLRPDLYPGDTCPVAADTKKSKDGWAERSDGCTD
jgi:DNA-binding LacI/PurR family transcriptional regulator